VVNQDTARSIVAAIGNDSRAAIVEKARKLRAEIAQTFADAEHWNRVNVPWKGPAIDPDPDGQLKRIADGIDRMLAAFSGPALGAELGDTGEAKERR
jgi:hypothetical protein